MFEPSIRLSIEGKILRGYRGSFFIFHFPFVVCHLSLQEEASLAMTNAK
jgi:hypothetical protein